MIFAIPADFMPVSVWIIFKKLRENKLSSLLE